MATEPPAPPAKDSGKILGIRKPAGYAVIAGAAVLGYFVWRWYQNRQAAAAAANDGAGAEAGSGGPVEPVDVVDVFSDWQGARPGGEDTKPAKGEKYRSIVVPKNMTVGQLAKELNWTPATLAAVLLANKTAGGGTFTTATRLHKGEV